MIQSKLNMIEDTVCWVNEEEALFKFPQSSYQDIGDITVKAPVSTLVTIFERKHFLDNLFSKPWQKNWGPSRDVGSVAVRVKPLVQFFCPAG